MAVTENHHRYARWNEQMFELWIVVVLLSAKIAVRSAFRQIRRKTNESNRISSVILFLYHHSFSLMVCICIHFESERAREQERTSFNSMWHIRRSKYRLLGTKRQHNIFKCILIIYAYWKSIWHWSTSKWICVTASMSTREPRERERASGRALRYTSTVTNSMRCMCTSFVCTVHVYVAFDVSSSVDLITASQKYVLFMAESGKGGGRERNGGGENLLNWHFGRLCMLIFHTLSVIFSFLLFRIYRIIYLFITYSL